MTILLVTNRFSGLGNTQQYLRHLIPALEANGHTVIPWSLEKDEFLDTRSRKRPATYSLQSVEAIKKIIKYTKPDIAHIHDISFGLTPSILVALRQKGIPVVQTVHDFHILCPNGQLFTAGSPCERCHKKRYWNAIQNGCSTEKIDSSFFLAYEMAFHHILLKTVEWGVVRYIVPSKFLHAKMLEWGWNTPDIQYIQPALGTVERSGVNVQYDAMFFIPLNDPAGSGVATVFAIAQQMPDRTFLIVREGDDAPSVDQISAQSLPTPKSPNISERIITADSDLHTAILSSRMVLMPSERYENAPMLLYTAAALGVPVIATQHGGIPEIIPQSNGILIPPGNIARAVPQAIEMILDQKSTYAPQALSTITEHVHSVTKLYIKAQHAPRQRITK